MATHAAHQLPIERAGLAFVDVSGMPAPEHRAAFTARTFHPWRGPRFVVHDGPGGLRVLGSPTPAIDLLITDVGLPGLGGRQLAVQARALRPQLRVLFITGYAKEAIFDVDAMPGPALLNKPFSMAELAARVTRLTHGS